MASLQAILRLIGFLVINLFKKKAFPFVGFGKESLMNENFKVASFPTFVLINEDGGVERVIGGYDQEVVELLFE